MGGFPDNTQKGGEQPRLPSQKTAWFHMGFPEGLQQSAARAFRLRHVSRALVARPPVHP
jgi:hypothetical protein